MTIAPADPFPNPFPRYRRLVQASAVYDLLATAAFATPWSFAWLHGLLSQWQPLPPFEPMHVLMANLMGSVVLVWSVVRLRHPLPVMGLYDGVARALFGAWQLYYLLVAGGVPLVAMFTVFELGFGVAQLAGYAALPAGGRKAVNTTVGASYA